MIRRGAGLAALGLITLLAGCSPSYTRAQSSPPTDYLIQMVCVDAADTPIFADPVDCPGSRRKLRIGEPLPYHKIDVGGFQISDSYPVADANGLTLGVQSYFFTDAFDDDPAFPNQVHHDPARGGYNIIGADEEFVFFRGTSDPGAYWQPWWTPDCRAQGWLLFPNDHRALRSGEAASPATFAPGCEGRIRTNASTVEWRYVAAQPFVVDPADPSRTRTLASIVVRHFSAGYGSMETNYFTREYGVTRWEAWRPGRGLTLEALKPRCPGGPYEARFHGRTFSMVDCRTWTAVVQPAGGLWDPDGASAVDPTIRTFPVDPLYTGRNLLENTHVGGPYEPEGSYACNEQGWTPTRAPAPLTPGTLDGPPWSANGNCLRTILAESVPAGAYGQTIDAPPPGDYRFGVSLFAPDLATGQTASAEVRLAQRDLAGGEVAVQRLQATIQSRYRTFEGEVKRDPRAATFTFEVSPVTAGIRMAVTGAYIAAR
ncbi:hypothetical protein [Brevundimonas sp.]|uniref:hypothetical protein n=1 Tax=Brevundimonas sp. TaxID=1871086 RepID=UPI001A31C467|nr:hypothetical protein [Brevundimonas sp.]MBJ7485256.1 hypothetical protein [Brevundimonas sp.]